MLEKQKPKKLYSLQIRSRQTKNAEREEKMYKDEEKANEKVQGFKEFLEYLKNRMGEEKFIKIEEYLMSAYVTGITHATQMILPLPENEGIDILLTMAANLEAETRIKKWKKNL